MKTVREERAETPPTPTGWTDPFWGTIEKEDSQTRLLAPIAEFTWLTQAGETERHPEILEALFNLTEAMEKDNARLLRSR